MIITTGNDVAGHKITAYLGIVRGIIAMRYDANEFVQGSTEVLAHGTAVKLERSDQPAPVIPPRAFSATPPPPPAV